MPRLTISMIVKNEEDYLPGCLQSVKEVADEIVIVDTGSSDKTIEIAKSFGAKVFRFKWTDDFAAARNYALSKSSGEWILYLDADERLLSESAGEIKKIIRSDEMAAYNCLVDCIDNHNNKPSIMKYSRLFRSNPRIQFKGRVHEQILPSLEKLNYTIKKSNIIIQHIGYDIPKNQLIEKAERNLNLLHKEFKRKPTIYIAFQIAQSYGVLEDEENVKKYFQYILNTPESPDLYKAHAYRYLAAKSFEKNQFKESLVLAKKGEKLDPNQPLLNMLIAKLYFVENEFDSALNYIIKAYDGNSQESAKDFELTIDKRALIYTALQIASAARNIEQFNFFYEKLSENYSNETSQNKLLNFVKALFNSELISGNLLEEYAETIDENNCGLILSLLENYSFPKAKLELLSLMKSRFTSNTVYLNMLGTSLMENGEFVNAMEVLEKSIQIDLREPSIIFYLISLYVQLEKFDKMQSVIELAERKFAQVPEVIERIITLKNKLALA